MKIKEVKCYILRYELTRGKAFAYSQAWYRSRSAMIIEIITDEGIAGLGEASGPPEVTSAAINYVYKPLLLRRDPFEIELIWEQLYNRVRDHGQKGVMVEALSAIDIALHDIVGKKLGVPVYKILGGAHRTRVKAYATGLYHRESPHLTEELIKEALHYVTQEFRAIKLKVGFGIEHDVKNVKALRESIGKDILLMVDANHGYDALNAIKLGGRITPYDIYWFEEPVPPEDIEGYLRVKNALDIPIAGGEAEYTRFGFREIISRGAVDIVQPDCCMAGGVSETKKICYLANAWGIQCIPHVWGSAVAVAAALQLVATIPNLQNRLAPPDLLFELDRAPNLFRDELANEPIALKNGYIEIPDRPGLGITLNRNIVKKYLVKM